MNWKDCGGRFKAGEAGMEASASRLCSAWRKWGRRICVHTMPFFWMWNCPEGWIRFCAGTARCGLFGGYRVCYEPSGAFAQGYTVHAQDYHQARGAGTHRRCNDYIARNCRLKERRSIVLQRGISQQDRYFLTEILYVEASNHSSIVYTYDKTQSYALTFAQMEKLLPAEDFKKCHRGYIVNLHAVKGLRRNSITLVDGREILVSTTYFQSVKDALIALRGGQ
ncbi:MAG: LytTR family DNA-binding domain-containing protein [Ruthenibacterium lactatiformans]